MSRRDSRLPNTLAPWYIVQNKAGWKYLQEGYEYASFSEKKSTAQVFVNLADAARVADFEKADVRVLFNKTHAIEFGRFSEEEEAA